MTDNIKPEHYRKGEIDLYEAFSQIFPHNEYRAGMQMIAMRYMFRNKIDRVEDLKKAIYTLERLKEKEIEHAEKNTKEQQEVFDDTAKDFGNVKAKTAGQYLDEIYFEHEDLLKRLWKANYLYLARDGNGKLYAFEGVPKKYNTNEIWETDANDFSLIKNDNFPEVKWSDEGPTKIADLWDIYQNGGENGKKEE